MYLYLYLLYTTGCRSNALRKIKFSDFKLQVRNFSFWLFSMTVRHPFSYTSRRQTRVLWELCQGICSTISLQKNKEEKLWSMTTRKSTLKVFLTTSSVFRLAKQPSRESRNWRRISQPLPIGSLDSTIWEGWRSDKLLLLTGFKKLQKRWGTAIRERQWSIWIKIALIWITLGLWVKRQGLSWAQARVTTIVPQARVKRLHLPKAAANKAQFWVSVPLEALRKFSLPTKRNRSTSAAARAGNNDLALL